MENESKWIITTEEKCKYMAEFVPYLPVLRAKAGISQEELSNLVGISRQTYGSVERGFRELTWNTFLSLLLFFDYNQSTHKMLHSSCSFMDRIVRVINKGEEVKEPVLDNLFDENQMNILKTLDDQAMNSLRTMLMVEYARCASISGEMVVRAFDGVKFNFNDNQEKAEIALQMLNKRKKGKRD